MASPLGRLVGSRLLRASPRLGSGQRQDSYQASPLVSELKGLAECERAANADSPEWRHVQRLAFPRTVPPVDPKGDFPSGYRPQLTTEHQGPYFVNRSRNHMLPVYLNVSCRNTRRITKLKNVLGDVQLLRDEIHDHLEKKNQRVMATRFDEIGCTIHVKGDFVDDVRNFLLGKGF